MRLIMKKREMPKKKHNFMGDSCFGGGVSESHPQTPPKAFGKRGYERISEVEFRRWPCPP